MAGFSSYKKARECKHSLAFLLQNEIRAWRARAVVRAVSGKAARTSPLGRSFPSLSSLAQAKRCERQSREEVPLGEIFLPLGKTFIVLFTK